MVAVLIEKLDRDLAKYLIISNIRLNYELPLFIVLSRAAIIFFTIPNEKHLLPCKFPVSLRQEYLKNGKAVLDAVYSRAGLPKSRIP